MVEAFTGVYLIRADVDQWSDQNALIAAGFDFMYIPIFFALNADGTPTGETIDGGAWGENIPANMAPPLREFFQNSGN
jgi:hypothetical protein